MHCHNFNLLPQTLRYIFSQCSMVWGYFQRVTMHYRQIYKKYIYIDKFFLKVMVTHGDTLQMVQNQANIRENIQ